MVLSVDVKEIQIIDDTIQTQCRERHVYVKIADVIGCTPPETRQGFVSSLFRRPTKVVLQYMISDKGTKGAIDAIHISGDDSICERFIADINEKLRRETQRPKKLAVFINPISGNQDAVNVYAKTVGPLFRLANISCDVMVSERPKHMVDLISAYTLKDTDGIVILGGDGTLQEVLNCLLPKIQQEACIDYNQPSSTLQRSTTPIGVIPTGSGNGASTALYGVHDVLTATLHIIKGHTKYIDVHGVYSGGKLVSYSAVSVSHGIFSDLMFFSDQNRWLKKLRYIDPDGSEMNSNNSPHRHNCHYSVHIVHKNFIHVIPIQMVMVKEKRLFKAKLSVIFNRRLKDEMQGKKSSNLLQEEREEMDGTFYSLSSWSTDLSQKFRGTFSESFRDLTIRSNDFILTIIFQCAGLHILRFFKELATKNPFAFKQDFMKNYATVGYKVKIGLDNATDTESDSVDCKLCRMISVDGELFEFENGEYEVWELGPLVNYFTCF